MRLLYQKDITGKGLFIFPVAAKLDNIYMHRDPLYIVYSPEKIENSIYKPFYDENTRKFKKVPT